MKQQQKVKTAATSAGSAQIATVDTGARHDRQLRTGSAAAVKSAIRPTDDDIAARAYSYWEARSFEAGCPEEDWYRALEELYREQN